MSAGFAEPRLRRRRRRSIKCATRCRRPSLRCQDSHPSILAARGWVSTGACRWPFSSPTTSSTGCSRIFSLPCPLPIISRLLVHACVGPVKMAECRCLLTLYWHVCVPGCLADTRRQHTRAQTSQHTSTGALKPSDRALRSRMLCARQGFIVHVQPCEKGGSDGMIWARSMQ